MTTRKSPVKHLVHSHRRMGKQVKTYNRGNGKPSPRQPIGANTIHVTNRQYLYGDFDKDGVDNIDDEEPYNSYVNTQANDKEVGLAEELQKIESAREPYEDSAQIVKNKLLQTRETVMYRIKTRNSIINKLRRKHLEEAQDIAGVRVLTDSDAESRKVGDFVETHFAGKIIAKDDHRNKDGFYTALHYTVIEGGKPVEIQVVTHRVADLALKAHKAYKTGHN